MLAKTDTINYENIAESIRKKNQYEAQYLPSEMARAIDRIETGELLPFKNALITQLNEQFNLELPMDSTTDEILSALSTVEDPKQIKKFFIDLMNYYFHSDLPYDATNEQIAFAFDHGVEQAVRQVQIELNSLIANVKSISDDFVTDPHTDAEPAWLDYCMDIRDYCQKAFDALLDLYA